MSTLLQARRPFMDIAVSQQLGACTTAAILTSEIYSVFTCFSFGNLVFNPLREGITEYNVQGDDIWSSQNALDYFADFNSFHYALGLVPQREEKQRP